MTELLLRTLSQGLQALMPVVVGLAWLRRHGSAEARTATRWGLVAALAATPVAGYLFRHAIHQARWEAALAASAAALASCLVRDAGRGLWSGSSSLRKGSAGVLWPVALAAAVVLLVARQTMEIDVVFMAAAVEVRSLDATIAVSAGVVVAVALALAYLWLSRAFSPRALLNATRAFGGIFLAQTLIYAFHESAEAGLLPGSSRLHAATEPYGPDGAIGQYFSWLLVALPLLAAVATAVGARRAGRQPMFPEWLLARPRWTVAIVGTLSAACVIAVWMHFSANVLSSVDPATGDAARAASEIAAGSRLLYQRAGADAATNVLALTALDHPSAGGVTLPLSCMRVAFAAGRGLCLQAERGLFTSYKALLIDKTMTPLSSFKLDGQPSRSRVSADGRLGAITVFVRGAAHGYAGTDFSTKTILVDMATGDVLGDLEQFSTWRDGAKIRAADFNFWGVTFARNSSTFYATLKTAGKPYLVQGDLGLRKMTVLHDNVECPSLSPDGRLIAYKKRTGNLSPWRIYVLDLATMTERPVGAETRSVDDQIEWLDDAHILYAVYRSSQSPVTDVWMSPIDGSGPARIFVEQAQSPIVIR